MTSDSGDAPGGSGGERRRITRAYYATDAPAPQAQQSGYGQGAGFGRRTGAAAGPEGAPPPLGGPSSRQPSRHVGGGRRGGIGGLLTIAAGAVAVIVAAVVIIVIKPFSAGPTGFVPTGATPGEDAQQITTAFLQDWQSGDLSKAARLTDDPSAASSALAAYDKDVNLQKLTGSVTTSVATTAPPASKAPGKSGAASASGAKPTSGPAASTNLQKVTYKLDATVSTPAGTTPAQSGTWDYHSSLVAYQANGSSVWYIEWRPDVVAPNLTASQHVAAVSVPPVVVSVTDSAGGQLTSYNDPGLTTISGLLQKKAPAGQGKPGLGVVIENAKNQAVPNSLATIVTAQNIGELATTIDPKAEKAAQAAVAQHKQSAMVVIQPSTGHILAIANNAGQNDFALTAAVAPGSDFKIVTSAALFTNGITSANSAVACPATYPVGGIVIHNDKNESEGPGTPFYEDFAQSCNNAFTQWWKQLSGSPDKLAYTAKQYFGLNEPWDIGISGQSAQYFKMKTDAVNSELAEEAFGQGTLQGSPIAMASVAATVENGSFKQPILVPGQKQVGASPLPAHTKTQLWQMMRAVVTQGTAAGQGFGSDVYAKTGTADVTAGVQPNAWFVAFAPDKDVAVADVVLDAGYGATNAAPQVKALLSKY